MEIEREIEKVLDRHIFRLNDSESPSVFRGKWDVLVSDLARLVTEGGLLKQEPSRENLRFLFAKHHQAHNSASEWREALMDDIMFWSRGESKKVCPTCKQEISHDL